MKLYIALIFVKMGYYYLLGRGVQPINSWQSLQSPDLLVVPSWIQLSDVTDDIPIPKEAHPKIEAKVLKTTVMVQLFSIVFLQLVKVFYSA